MKDVGETNQDIYKEEWRVWEEEEEEKKNMEDKNEGNNERRRKGFKVL